MVSINKVINSLIQLLSLSSGRDKVSLFIIRHAGLYNIYVGSSKHVHQRAQLKIKGETAQSLGNAMAMTRKVLRFGPSILQVKILITNIIDLVQVRNTEQDHIVILKSLSAFFLAMFFIFDHYIWLFRVGIVNNQQLKVQSQYYSSLGWFLQCFTTIAKDLAIYFNTRPQQRKKIQLQLGADLVRSICDIPVAYSFLKPGSVDGRVVGLLGTFTSLIGIYQLWK